MHLEKESPSPEFQQTLDELIAPHGGNIVAVLGYGSNFGGYSKNIQDSIWDTIVVVEDLEKFHKYNLEARPKDYWRFLRSTKLQAWLNRLGMNYIQSEGIDGTRFKYPVISLEDVESDCFESKFADYAAGRLQKSVRLIHTTGDLKKLERLNTAIEFARLRGAIEAILTIGPNEFSTDDFLAALVRLSYLSDVRLEDPKKVEKIIENTRLALLKIYEPILESVAESGDIERIKGGFRTRGISESDQRFALQKRTKMKPKTALLNFVKNPLSNTRSISYALAKVAKWRQGKKQTQPIVE